MSFSAIGLKEVLEVALVGLEEFGVGLLELFDALLLDVGVDGV